MSDRLSSKKTIVILGTPLLVLCGLLLTNIALAQSTPISTSEAQRPATLEEYREVLNTERKILQDEAKEYYSRVENFAYISLAILVAALGAIIWFFKWMFGQTRTEVITQLKSELQGSVSLAGNELEQFKREKIEALHAEYQKLKAHLESINSFGEREVVWLLKDDMPKPEREIAALRAVGLTRVAISAPKIDAPDEVNEALKRADLAIITFDGSQETQTLLRHASASLKFRQPPVSLLIYTYGHYLNDRPVQLGPGDLEQLQGLASFAPANFPATLVSQAQSLIIKNRSWSCL